ncbi:MAG: FHA domain-containing protein [Thermosynechococcaceae cyanobacterium MS004]|nr:FHA domain-containing protein [Thermosynechococcaceae cyanobacterium MS004]
MKNQTLESHVLVIHDQPEPRRVLLKSATYSIGRDKRNSIVIPNRAISRQQALLLRLPNPKQGGYRYRILDGNATGKPSLNGLSVNNKECTFHDLNPGDLILLGNLIRVNYEVLNVASDAKYFDYLKIQTPEYQSIRTEPISPRATIIAELQRTAIPTMNQPILDNWDEDDSMATELFNGVD